MNMCDGHCAHGALTLRAVGGSRRITLVILVGGIFKCSGVFRPHATVRLSLTSGTASPFQLTDSIFFVINSFVAVKPALKPSSHAL